MKKEYKDIFEKYFIENGNNCWVWKGGTTNGYGSFHTNGMYISAHRFSWFITNGEIPEGFLVCHHCDNPPCVNPKHLFLGTPKDNVQDKMKKGRHNPPQGERQWKSKITSNQVKKIRNLYDSGKYTQQELGTLFSIGQSNISYIVNKTWQHV